MEKVELGYILPHGPERILVDGFFRSSDGNIILNHMSGFRDVEQVLANISKNKNSSYWVQFSLDLEIQARLHGSSDTGILLLNDEDKVVEVPARTDKYHTLLDFS